MKTLFRDVQPSLRGLILTSMDAQAPVLWPWQSVSRVPNGMLIPVSADGSHLMENGRKVQFRFLSQHAKLVARCAHRRWMKNAFRQRQFHLAEHVNIVLITKLMLLFCAYGIMFLLGPPIFFVGKFLVNQRQGLWSEMPNNYLLLCAATAIFLCFASGALALFCVWFALRFLRQRNLREIVLDGDGIQLRTRDEQDVRYAWNDIATITIDNEIRFADGHRVWVTGWSRGLTMIQEARDQLFPNAYDAGLLRAKKRFGMYLAFAGIYVLIMAFLATSLPPIADRPQPFFALAIILFAASAFSLLVPTSWCRLDGGSGKKYLKHCRKQHRTGHRKTMHRMLNRKFVVDSL